MASAGDSLSVSEISRRLSPLAPQLAPKLIPLGKQRGREWVALASVKGRLIERSLSIVIAPGKKQGFYVHFSAGRFGDLITAAQDLWGLAKGEAVAWAKEELGLGPGLDPEARARAEDHARRAQAAAEAAAAQADHATQDKAARARFIWLASGPLAGTPGERYFRSRGITLPLPASLRFHPALPYGARDDAPRFPAVVAAVQDPDGRLSGIWRIYLRPDGLAKAPVEKPKLGLGGARGGAVRLGPAATRLATAEGIETALSIQQATGLTTWAGLSASGVAGMILPLEVREPVICPDPDLAHVFEETGRVYWPGPDAAFQAAERYRIEGRRPSIAEFPLGLDANDLLMRGRSF